MTFHRFTSNVRDIQPEQISNMGQMRSPHRRLSRNGVVVACEDGWQLIEELHAELRAIHFHLKALRAELKAVEKEVTELRAVEKEVTS